VTNPISISISPVGFNAKAGDTITMTVTDRGTGTMAVYGIGSKIHSLSGNKCVVGLDPQSLEFNPARFTLTSGESRRVSVKIIHGTKGEHIGVIFYASEKSVGNAHINAGVAGQIAINAGQLNCSGVVPPGTNISLIVILCGVVVIVGMGIWAFFLRRSSIRRRIMQ
jgi:hypothetical protein